MPRVSATRLVVSALRQHSPAYSALQSHPYTAVRAYASASYGSATATDASALVQQCTVSGTAGQVTSHPSDCSCGSCLLKCSTRLSVCSATTDCKCAACSTRPPARLGVAARLANTSSESSTVKAIACSATSDCQCAACNTRLSTRLGVAASLASSSSWGSTVRAVACSATSDCQCAVCNSRRLSIRSSSNNVWCRNITMKPAAVWLNPQRGFSCFSTAALHEACSHNHDDHHQATDNNTRASGNTEGIIGQIRAAKDLQQLQHIIQHNSSGLAASVLSTAFRQTLLLTANSPSPSDAAAVGAAEAVLNSLTPSWLQSVDQASITDLSDCLFSCAKLGFKDSTLWSKTLAVVPARCGDGDGRDLANIAYALAVMAESNGGKIPGVSREDAAEVLRAVTHQIVSMVSGPGGASDHSHHHHHHDHHDGHTDDHDGGCGHDHKSDKKSVTIGNISTVRWAHEVFDSLHSE